MITSGPVTGLEAGPQQLRNQPFTEFGLGQKALALAPLFETLSWQLHVRPSLRALACVGTVNIGVFSRALEWNRLETTGRSEQDLCLIATRDIYIEFGKSTDL